MKAACQEVPAISLQKGERDTGKLWATQEHSHEGRQRSEAVRSGHEGSAGVMHLRIMGCLSLLALFICGLLYICRRCFIIYLAQSVLNPEGIHTVISVRFILHF